MTPSKIVTLSVSPDAYDGFLLQPHTGRYLANTRRAKTNTRCHNANTHRAKTHILSHNAKTNTRCHNANTLSAKKKSYTGERENAKAP